MEGTNGYWKDTATFSSFKDYRLDSTRHAGRIVTSTDRISTEYVASGARSIYTHWRLHVRTRVRAKRTTCLRYSHGVPKVGTAPLGR